MKLLLGVASINFVIISASISYAQDAQVGGGESILVTARKTSEDLQSVPASITALTADDLNSAGIDNLQDLAPTIPNVAMSGGIAGAMQGGFGIRGISTLVRNIGIESGVGFYVDGVYQGRPDNYNQEFIDVAQVEVLRGPQGTIFGRNTIAGAFNITTVQPVDGETQSVFNAELGDYGLVRLRGYVTGPLVDDDTLAGKLSLGYVTRNGFYTNLSGGPNGDTLDTFSYRSSLYYTPNSNSQTILTVDGLYDRGNPGFFQVTDLYGATTPNEITEETTPHTIDNNRPDYLHRDNYGVSLTEKVNISAGTLTSITAYRQSSYQASLDDDQNQVDYVAIDRWGDRTDLWTEELRFNGDLGPKGDYVAGLFYLRENISTAREIAIGPGLGIPGEPLLTTNGNVLTNTYAAYANFNYHLTDLITASLGVRFSVEDKDVGFAQGDLSGVYAQLGYPALHYANAVSDSDVSPTAALSYRITPAVMAYASIARGFKSAAFNVDIVQSADGIAAGPEEATSYEIGLKSNFYDNRVRLNVALFTTDYANMQVEQLLGTAISLNNAARATISGGEAEVTALITPQLRFGVGVGALNARYDTFDNCDIPASLGGGSTDCSGKQIIGAPDWTGSASAEYTHPTSWGRFIARLDYQLESPVYYDATNSKRFETNTRNIFNLRTGFDFGRYEVGLFVKNLTNDTYITYADDRSELGVLKTTAYGDPRTFGATFSVRT